MHYQLGWTYKFEFINGFTVLNGTYVVVKSTTYSEMINDGKDLYTYLYQLVSKDSDDLSKDVEVYRKEEILKLVSTNEVELEIIDDTNTVTKSKSIREIYVPISILSTVPIFNVQQYNKIVLSYYLGTYPGEEDLEYVTKAIQEKLSTDLGYVEDPKIITIEKVWLTDDEYATLKKDRDEAKSEVLNYYSENLKLQEEISSLKATIAGFNLLFNSINGES